MSSTRVDQESGNGSFVVRDLFRDVIGQFANGVTIITARQDETDLEETGTWHAITKSGAFAGDTLHEDQGELAAKFARPDTDKYQGVKVAYGELGAKPESAIVVRSQQPYGVALTAIST